MGPLWKLSSMRFESFHRIGKIAARAAISRVNLAYTTITKHLLKLNYLLSGSFSAIETYETGPLYNVSVEAMTGYQQFSSQLPMLHDSKRAKYIKYMGNQIELGSILVTHGENGPKFFIVKHILIDSAGKLCIVAQKCGDVMYNSHFHACTKLTIACQTNGYVLILRICVCIISLSRQKDLMAFFIYRKNGYNKNNVRKQVVMWWI